MHHQRKKDKGKPSRLTDEKECLLNEIGFVWNVNEQQWNGMLKKLKDYRFKYGHCNVRIRSSGDLGKWVMTQRVQYGRREKGQRSFCLKSIFWH